MKLARYRSVSVIAGQFLMGHAGVLRAQTAMLGRDTFGSCPCV